MRRALPLILIALSSFHVWAQEMANIYNMKTLPQSFYANPSFIPLGRINIAIPALGSQYISPGKSDFVLSKVFIRDNNGNYTMDTDRFLNGLNDRNLTTVYYVNDLLHFGIAIEKNYFMFNITDRIRLLNDFPRNFAFLIGDVLESQIPRFPIEIDELKVDYRHFREYGLGYARRVDEKLTVGGRLKLYSGLVDIQTINDISIENIVLTDLGNPKLTGPAIFNVTSSGLSEYENNPSGLITGYNNYGFAMDIGGRYVINRKYEFAASILDMFGTINWQSNVRNYNTDTVEVEISPVTADELRSFGDIGYLTDYQQFLDSLSREAGVEVDNNSYQTKTPTRLFVSGGMYVLPRLQAMILTETVFREDQTDFFLRVSANGRVKRFLGYTLSYAVVDPNQSSLNLGAGFTVSTGPVQFHAIADNIFDPFQLDEQNQFSFRFGFNLVIGRDYE
jgi:hypothetical protein